MLLPADPRFVKSNDRMSGDTMNLLAIVGSPRKGKATDTLVDKALDGFRSKSTDFNIRKINLIDYNIQFCRNCLSCS